MDAKARKALIDSLSDKTNFDAALNEENRRWVAGKLIDVFAGRGASDADMKSKATDTVARAKTLVKKQRDFALGFKLSKSKEAATERTLRTRRVEILYGLVAHDPELADSSNEAQLMFIARRRYRVIERFQFFVNPNGRGYFLYPEDCAGNAEWRVNFLARRDFWEAKTNAYLPIEIKTSTNPPDILAAIEILFTRFDEVCKANLLDCESTLSILHMDAMREGKDPKKWLEALYARGSTYLCVNLATRPPTFSADISAQGLFTIGNRPKVDLCVGDHVYIFNHGLYQVLLPGGSWRGEHAIATDSGDRGLTSSNGFKFMGHGLPHGGEPGSIPRFYTGRLNELNKFLYRSYRIGGMFLFYMKSGGTAFPGKVIKQTRTIADPVGTQRSVDFYFFDLDFSYPNFTKKVVKIKDAPKNSEHGFVVWHSDATRQFGIHRKKTIADALTDGIASDNNRPIFRRPAAPASAAEMFDPTKWAIPFPAPSGNQEDYAVFQPNGTSVKAKILEMSDLYVQPFFRFNPGTDDDMWMARPKVDVGATYTGFLTSNGAI